MNRVSGILHIKTVQVCFTLSYYKHNTMDFSQIIYAAIDFVLDLDTSDRIPMKASRWGESPHAFYYSPEW